MPLSPLYRPARRRKAILRLVPIVAAVAFATAALPPSCDAPPGVTAVSKADRLGIGPCPLFPSNNAFHAAADLVPVDPRSNAIVSSMRGLSVRFGGSSAIWQGSRGGIPVNVVDSRKSKFGAMTVDFDPQADSPVRFPLPAQPRLEGDPGIAWDRHMIVVDVATCRSYEFFWVIPNVDQSGSWHAWSHIVVDLRSNDIQQHSSNAAGTSLLAGMVRYDEVASGAVNHAISITVPTISRGAPLWPASTTDGKSNDPNAPHMGQWLRLKAGVDTSGLGPESQVVARALKEHGAIVSDTGPSRITLGAQNDDRWDDTDLSSLGQLERE